MQIAIIISSGLVLMTFFAALFDYFARKKKYLDDDARSKVFELERKVNILETLVNNRDENIYQLEKDVTFVTKLLQNKE